MQWQVARTAEEAEQAAAQHIAGQLVRALASRGRATLAVSGGRSPWGMLERLATCEVDWNKVHVLQVDERMVPLDHEDRNWSRFLQGSLAKAIPDANLHPMPVDIEDAEVAVGKYSALLLKVAGGPPQLDVVHLGIGTDGHTASLFAGDALLDDRRHWVGVSRRYEGHRRLTLTLPVLNNAKARVWFATGASRRGVLERLQRGDMAIPASHVRGDGAVCFADLAAAPAAWQGSP